VFAGFSLLLFWQDNTPVASVPVEIYTLVVSPMLPAIPLFTLAGYILVAGGATRRLLRVFTALFAWLPGGMAVVTVVICAVFTWGGSGLTILSLGGLLVPVLIKARYPEKFSLGLVTASGSLGLLFPPSIPVILYGVYAAVPIDRLFIGGLLPGVLMVVLVAGWGIFQGVRSGAERHRFSPRDAALAIWQAKWELFLPVIMLVGLFGGFGTLTEAAALTVFAAFMVERFAYRSLSLRRDFAPVTVEAATVVGGVMIILGVALGFTNYLIDAEVPRLLVEWTQANIRSKFMFLLVVNLFLLVVGALMDIFAAILVIVPLLRPLVEVYGIDPVQMGIIFLSNLELGYLTPPVGMNLFLTAYRFQKPMMVVARALIPFVLIMLFGVLLITYVPWMTLAPLRWLGR
jgi:tripartite ATP-independent transporter DctM subunit